MNTQGVRARERSATAASPCELVLVRPRRLSEGPNKLLIWVRATHSNCDLLLCVGAALARPYPIALHNAALIREPLVNRKPSMHVTKTRPRARDNFRGKRPS